MTSTLEIIIVGAAKTSDRAKAGNFTAYNNTQEADHCDILNLMRSLSANVQCYDPIYPSSGRLDGVQYIAAELPDAKGLARSDNDCIIINFSCIQPVHVANSSLIWIDLANSNPHVYRDNSITELPFDIIRVFGGNIGFTSFRDIREYCQMLRDAGVYGPHLIEPIRQAIPVLQHMYWPEEGEIRDMLSVYLATESMGTMFSTMLKALRRRDDWLSQSMVDYRLRLTDHILLRQ